jgi:hypothetical protein
MIEGDDPKAQVEFKQHNISTKQALAMCDWLLDVDARVIDAIKFAKKRGFCSSGDAVIVVTGWVRFKPFYSRYRLSFVRFYSSVLVMARLIHYVLSMPTNADEHDELE